MLGPGRQKEGEGKGKGKGRREVDRRVYSGMDKYLPLEAASRTLAAARFTN